MKRIKVKLIGKGTEDDPFTVDLPTWTMDGNPDYQKKTCYVFINDDEAEPGKHKINQQKIRTKYKKSWGKFNASDVELEYD